MSRRSRPESTARREIEIVSAAERKVFARRRVRAEHRCLRDAEKSLNAPPVGDIDSGVDSSWRTESLEKSIRAARWTAARSSIDHNNNMTRSVTRSLRLSFRTDRSFAR